jgi:GNAT superfamily N-acetyltransferase
MITISEAIPKDFKTIEQIAYKTWSSTYGEILSKNQIDFMLESMYSQDVLNFNFTNKMHRFLLLNEFENSIGFASYEHHYLDANCTRLHKLYILPETKGKGFGMLILDKVIELSKENKSDKISLNVNRFNTAYVFYQKMGFEIVGEENLSIGNGYFMEDYKMEKRL